MCAHNNDHILYPFSARIFTSYPSGNLKVVLNRLWAKWWSVVWPNVLVFICFAVAYGNHANLSHIKPIANKNAAYKLFKCSSITSVFYHHSQSDREYVFSCTPIPMLSSVVWKTPHLHVHYNDVIMSMIASQITSLTVVYSSIKSADRSKIKAPRDWPLWGEFTGDRWIPRTKGQ